jgi:hypothetical protein
MSYRPVHNKSESLSLRLPIVKHNTTFLSFRNFFKKYFMETLYVEIKSSPPYMYTLYCNTELKLSNPVRMTNSEF